MNKDVVLDFLGQYRFTSLLHHKRVELISTKHSNHTSRSEMIVFVSCQTSINKIVLRSLKPVIILSAGSRVKEKAISSQRNLFSK